MTSGEASGLTNSGASNAFQNVSVPADSGAPANSGVVAANLGTPPANSGASNLSQNVSANSGPPENSGASNMSQNISANSGAPVNSGAPENSGASNLSQNVSANSGAPENSGASNLSQNISANSGLPNSGQVNAELASSGQAALLPAAPLGEGAPKNFSLPPISATAATAAAAPSTLEAPVAKPKAARSEAQAKADQGQAEMLLRLRNLYANEFSNIPERFRPKPKAYVARAAYYKPTENARNAYIGQWLKKDREAAEVRMGARAKAPLPPVEEETSAELNSGSRRHLLSIGKTRRVNFHPSADPLKAQAVKAEDRLEEATHRAEKKLLSKAPNSATRKVAKELVAEMKRQAAALVKEAKRQAVELEKAAKARLREEAKAAFAEIEAQASKNLAASLGYNPPKYLTQRLAKARNSGASLAASNFVNAEESKGRYTRRRGRGAPSKANNRASVNLNYA